MSGKLVKLLPPDVRFQGQNVPNSISAGAAPQTPLGSLQRSPDPKLYLRGLLLRGIGEEKGGFSPNWGVWIRQCAYLYLLVSVRLSYHSVIRLWKTNEYVSKVVFSIVSRCDCLRLFIILLHTGAASL